MALQPQAQDEKEQKAEIKVKKITDGTWENKVNSTLQFINNTDMIQNMGQLIDIVSVYGRVTNSSLGAILIYYWSAVSNTRVTNSPILCCKPNRRDNLSHQESADCIVNLIATHQTQQTLFKIGHSTQASGHPITFVWYWSVKPIFTDASGAASSNNGVYNQRDHILRNHGNNVATIDRACSVKKPAIGAVNLFQPGYDGNKYAYVTSSQIFHISFDRAYVLNTLRFWLYDSDGRVYKYQIEISKDEQVWRRIANHENKASWQDIQFDAQFVKHVRFINGSNSTNQFFHLCKFYAFFDYAVQ